MQDLFNKVGKFAKETASVAADKTEELVETGKLKSQIASAKTEISTAKKQIGEYYYSKYSTEGEADEAIVELCKEIKAQEDKIAELESKIALLK